MDRETVMVANSGEAMPVGFMAGKVYRVSETETAWRSLSDPERDSFKVRWIEEARSRRATHVVLQLNIDPLFPVFGNTRDYVEWQRVLDTAPSCGFTTHIEARFILALDESLMSPRVSGALTMAKAWLPKGTLWRVIQGEETLDSGMK